MAARLLSLCGNWDTSNKAAQNAYPATGDNGMITCSSSSAAWQVIFCLKNSPIVSSGAGNGFLGGGLSWYKRQEGGLIKTNKDTRDSCQIFREAQRAEKVHGIITGSGTVARPSFPTMGFNCFVLFIPQEEETLRSISKKNIFFCLLRVARLLPVAGNFFWNA